MLTLVVTVMAVSVDARGGLRWLQAGDRRAAQAIGTISVWRLYNEYTDRFAMCRYRDLVVCVPRKDYGTMSVLRRFELQSAAMQSESSWSDLANIPKLPDATLYAFRVSLRDGPWATAMLVGYLLVCLALAIVVRRAPVVWLVIPAVVLLIFTIAKWLLLLAAHGALVVLEVLLFLGGIPASLAVAVRSFNASREIKEGVADVIAAIVPRDEP